MRGLFLSLALALVSDSPLLLDFLTQFSVEQVAHTDNLLFSLLTVLGPQALLRGFITAVGMLPFHDPYRIEL